MWPRPVAPGRSAGSDRDMDTERSSPDDVPNAVLRGGPFEGERVRVAAPVPVVRIRGLVRHVYEPTDRRDDEFPALVVYVHRHTLIY